MLICLSVVATVSSAGAGDQESQLPAYITTRYPMILLSANDGECRFMHTFSGLRQKPVNDSITVIRSGPDHPPLSRTVIGTVPVTIYGSPHVAITVNGRYGFISNHNWRDWPLPGFEEGAIPPGHPVNVLTVVDLASDDLNVADHVELPAAPWMVDLHPDGQQVIVSVGASFRIYAVQNHRLIMTGPWETPADVFSFDVSPRGDRILAVTMDSDGQITDLQLHLFQLRENEIVHLQRIEAAAGIGPIDRLFSPRISPDGRKALVLEDLGQGGKGSLDDVLLIDLDRDIAVVTERIPQVGDGLESLAFHPRGRFAVICCLENGLCVSSVRHLAVIDLTLLHGGSDFRPIAGLQPTMTSSVEPTPWSRGMAWSISFVNHCPWDSRRIRAGRLKRRTLGV